MSLNKIVKEASEHHSNLNNFGAIVSLCESGLFYGRTPPEVMKIIRIAKSGMQSELRKYDAAIAKLGEKP
jgi:hypothetical protein